MNAFKDEGCLWRTRGCLHFGMRHERLMQEHDSKPQNPIIANVLHKSKTLESWGRGIGTMVDECKRVG